MKNILIILVINFFLVSCIDMIKSSDEDFYESIHMQGGGWLEFYQNSEIELLELNDDFTFQIWFSGQEETGNDAPCIMSLKGNQSNIAIYRNPNINNIIMIYDNEQLIQEVELETLDLSYNQNFYLISIIKIQNQITIYINDTAIKELATVENNVWDWIDLNNNNLYDDGEFESFIDEQNGIWDQGETFIDANENDIYDQAEEFIDSNENGTWDEGETFSDANENEIYDQAEEFIDGNNAYDLGEEFEDIGVPLVIINDETMKPIIGAIINNNNNPENLWYGYIDEVRLWDIALHDTTINFHNQYPTKLSSSYNDHYLLALNGLWDFRINTSEDNINNIFQDVNDNLIYTIIYTLESMINNLSDIGR